jgi:hypothetical protein
MIVAIIFVALSFIALLLIFYLVKGHHRTGADLNQLASQLRPVDVNAFRNLIDENEERYLREHLDLAEYRSIRRERKVAAIEYILCAASNAAILIRLAEAAQHNPDPAISAAADRLLENAVRLRLYCFRVVPQLYLSVLLPSLGFAPARIADSYDAITRQVVMLGCLQYPTRGMSSAL